MPCELDFYQYEPMRLLLRLNSNQLHSMLYLRWNVAHEQLVSHHNLCA